MQLRIDVGKPFHLKPDSEIVDIVAAMFLMIFMLIFALACAMGMAGMYSLMRIFRRELNLLHVQSEAWARIHDQQGQLLQSVQEVRGEILQLRRRHQDSLDTLYHGLEIQLGTLANARAMIQELHARRADVAEVQHVSYLRHRLNEAMQQIQDLQAGSSTGVSDLPAIPDGTEMQLL